MPKFLEVIIVSLLLGTMFFMSLGSSFRESQTIDEAAHIAAGYSYITLHDYRLNPEHPPLIKMICAFPLLFLRLKFPSTSSAWIDSNEWDAGRLFLYDNIVPFQTILEFGRIMNIIIALIFGLSLYCISRHFFGKRAACIALFLYCFDPLFLAHSHYITTDIGIALFFFVSIFFWCKFLTEHRAFLFALSSLFFACAQATKFSAVILLPCFIILFLLRSWQVKGTREDRFFSFKSFLSYFVYLFGITFVFLFAIYQFEIQWIRGFPVVLSSYFNGLRFVKDHNASGHLAYLFGTFSWSGWWYYFPAVWMLKTPMATVILFFLAILLWAKTCISGFRLKVAHNFFVYFKKIDFRYFFIFFPPLIYFAWSMTSKINLGIRHLSPIYPFVYMIISTLSFTRFRVLWQRMVWEICVVMIFALYVFTTAISYPYFISYFSEIIGGQSNGHKYLLDSNIDWGQGLYYMRDYITRNAIPEKDVYFAVFHSASPNHYGIQFQGFPEEIKSRDLSKLPKGVYFISVSYACTQNLDLQWIFSHPPTDSLGGAIFVYDLR